jgi:hypothetical protein
MEFVDEEPPPIPPSDTSQPNAVKTTVAIEIPK